MRWATWNRALALLGAALGAGLLVGCEQPPSILLVTLDTVRRDHVGAYGDPRGLTPAFDALAAEGLLHEAAYTTMPTTGPAHLSLMTGLYPSQHGGRRNGERLIPDFAADTAPSQLRRRGYHNAAFVTTKLMQPRLLGLRGFPVFDAPSGALRPGDDAVEAALAWLDQETRRPVLLWVHLYDAHSPYGTADEKRRSFPVDPKAYGWVKADGRYASADARQEIETRYARGVQAADAALGQLVDGVRQRLASPPLIIVVSDHGESFAEHLAERGFAYDHGESLDEEAVTLALVVAGPGVVPGRTTGAVSIRDLYTTLLEAARVGDPEAGAAGRRDLRLPDENRRLVAIERRRAISSREAVRSHAAAASDGSHLLVVGENGSVTQGTAGYADLERLARRHLDGASAPATPLDADTREALEQLGYGE